RGWPGLAGASTTRFPKFALARLKRGRPPTLPDFLRLKIERGAQAAIHVERHRRMDVRDTPAVVAAFQHDGVAQPETDRLWRHLRLARHAGQAVMHGEVAADRQRAGRRFELYRPFPGVEPGLLGLGVDAAMDERRRQIAHGRILAI